MLVQRSSVLQIQNTIVTADLMQPVDITRLNDFEWGRYDIVNNYNGKVGYVKDQRMQGRVTVFTSGKLISTGAKSVQKAAGQLERTLKLLVASDFVKRIKLEPRVRNIVATMDLQSKVDLNSFVTLTPKSFFEPEQFPGVVHRMGDDATCLIFASGKVIITGAKSEKQLVHASETLVNRIMLFLMH